MTETTHEALVRQTGAAEELLDYFQGHRTGLEARQAAAEGQFAAWRQDRDTLGELNAKGSRRVGVFQGFAINGEGVGLEGHFTLPDAVMADASANVYLHLKTPLNVNVNTAMFLYDVSGYAYGESSHIDGKVAGYCYATSSTLTNLSAEGSHGLTAYAGSDGQVYLRMLFASTYFLTLAIDGIRVGNGGLPAVGSLTPIFSTQVTL